MNTYWIVFASTLIINAVIAVVIAARLAYRPKAPGRNSVIFMLVMLAIWSFTYAISALAPSMDAKKLMLKIGNIGILFVPVFWFLFTAQYAWPKGKSPSWYFGVPVFIIPLITLSLVWSNDWFHYYYSSLNPVSETGGPLIIERGPWYLYATIHAYLLNLSGMVLLIRRAIEFRNIYRRQANVLICAVVVPILTNIFYQIAASLKLSPMVRVDLTPISLTISAALIAFGIFNLHIFDLLPIARHTVMEHIPEMVFVVNADHRVIDINNVGLNWLKKSAEQVIGQNPTDVFKDWSELVDNFSKTHHIHQIFQMPGNPPRTIEMVVTPLHDSFDNLQGRVIVAHDISDHIRLEDALRVQLTENEALRMQLQEQAIRDPLTNVYNRRFLAESLDREIPRAKREERPVSIVILDVDHFKKFNDTYGHKCGDEVLQFLANLLVSNTRREDIICRYGGEEFIILMANTTLETAYERAEALRQMTEQSRVEYEGLDLGITFSAGVASFPIHGQTGESVLQAADKALYRSKNNGRNRVTTFNK